MPTLLDLFRIGNRTRRNMTDAQLTQNYPGDSYPIPLKDLLIRR